MTAISGGAAPAPELSSLTVGIDNLRSDKGMIRLCLTPDPSRFPDCIGDSHAITRSVPATRRSIVLDDVAPGTYALAVIHDENSNAKLDTLIGIPREGFGFSRNPAVRFGPPRFSSARFDMGSAPAREDVRMRYIF